ncbi:MAG: outer membrane beta-barrel protein [Rhodocyclaceae bacterium]
MRRSTVFGLMAAAYGTAFGQAGLEVAPLQQQSPVQAQQRFIDDGDVFHVYVSQGLRYDSNVFRLADDTHPEGKDHQDDWISQTSAGLDFNKQFGRQRVYGFVGGSLVRFSDFDQLDYNSTSIRAGWTTGFGSDSTASLKYQNYRAPMDIADRVNRSLNMVTDNRLLADAAVRVAGPWMVVGGVIGARSRNSADDAKGGDNDSFSAEAGVRYAPRTDNYVDLRFRQSKYDYVNVLAPDTGGDPSSGGDNSYKQSEWRVSALYEPTGVSTFDGYVAWQRREHDHLASRDFSGWSGQLNYTWNVTTITALKFQVYRELGAINDASATYARTTGASFRPYWQATSKIALSALLDYRKRQYTGNQAAGSTLPQRKENTWTLGVNADWQITRNWLIQASLASAHRNANVAADSYDDVLAFANVRYRF